MAPQQLDLLCTPFTLRCESREILQLSSLESVASAGLPTVIALRAAPQVRTATPAKVKGCIKAKVERHTALRNNHLTAYCSVYCWTVPLLISCSSSSRKLFGTSSSVHANCGHICRPAA